MSPFLLLIFLLCIAYEFYQFYHTKIPNSPPGLPRLPIVGSYLHLLWGNYDFPYKTVDYYVKRYKSKIVSCYLGSFYSIIFNDYKSIKEVLSKEEFDGRFSDADVLKARAFGKKLGIFFIEGDQWKEQRRFALRHMRDFGFGRRHEKLESEISDEVAQLIDTIKFGPINDEERTVLQDGCALFPDISYALCVNSIWLVMFGERFDRQQHADLRFVSRGAMMFQRAGDTTGGAIFQQPFLKHFGNMFGYKNTIIGNYRIVDFVKKYLGTFKNSHCESSDRGLVDRYLKVLRENNVEASSFSEEQLIMSVVDFLFPAFSALPSALTHCIKFVMHHPEVLRKVQKEIETVVGTGRHVMWEDRKTLPYTEATIREVLRCETMTPFGVIHKCLRDTTICSYNVPKGTAIITNLAAMNNDRDFWGDPERFRPERFLNDEGQLGKDYTFPFGFGHRVCAGETFARYVLFGTFAALLQNFDFSFVKGEPSKLKDKLPGLIVTPREAWIRMTPRQLNF